MEQGGRYTVAQAKALSIPRLCSHFDEALSVPDGLFSALTKRICNVGHYQREEKQSIGSLCRRNGKAKALLLITLLALHRSPSRNVLPTATYDTSFSGVMHAWFSSRPSVLRRSADGYTPSTFYLVKPLGGASQPGRAYLVLQFAIRLSPALRESSGTCRVIQSTLQLPLKTALAHPSRMNRANRFY